MKKDGYIYKGSPDWPIDHMPDEYWDEEYGKWAWHWGESRMFLILGSILFLTVALPLYLWPHWILFALAVPYAGLVSIVLIVGRALALDQEVRGDRVHPEIYRRALRDGMLLR